uniref:C-type lectin domain-containing protein n=1 Tax=Pelusios castaneus TaxID=367368 RepID=A0A8C8SSA8_9SAUR
MECAWVSRYLVHIICLVMFMQHLSSSCQLFMTYLCSAMPYTGPVPTTLAKSSSTCPMCPDGWVGYQRKCYYFSETEGNWSYCQSSCSSPDASLVWIDSEKEIVRHSIIAEYWPWPGVTAAIELGLPAQDREQLLSPFSIIFWARGRVLGPPLGMG